jgi:drug/metabolite transporter (DMT)-like permease
VASVLCVVVRDLAVRQMGNHVPSIIVALAAAVMVAVMGLGLSLVPTAGMGTNFYGLTGWVAMDMVQVAQVGAAGTFLIVGYLCAVTAMRWGDIGVVAPFRYTSLLWAIILGFAAFGEMPDGWTLVGSAIVVASGIYTLLRERQKRRMTAMAARAEG